MIKIHYELIVNGNMTVSTEDLSTILCAYGETDKDRDDVTVIEVEDRTGKRQAVI